MKDAGQMLAQGRRDICAVITALVISQKAAMSDKWVHKVGKVWFHWDGFMSYSFGRFGFQQALMDLTWERQLLVMEALPSLANFVVERNPYLQSISPKQDPILCQRFERASANLEKLVAKL